MLQNNTQNEKMKKITSDAGASLLIKIQFSIVLTAYSFCWFIYTQKRSLRGYIFVMNKISVEEDDVNCCILKIQIIYSIRI